MQEHTDKELTHDELLLALKGLRSAKGISQSALSERLGIAQSQISRTESGETTIDYVVGLLNEIGFDVRFVVKEIEHVDGE